MWRRVQWGLIAAFGYIIVSTILGFIVFGEPNLSLILGLATGGFISGITYLYPPPKQWRKK
ncbi:hypothetical protein VKA52_18620 [Halobacillus sp. HZG1]|uniref:hypothetical protein n=1 Tax=Halobacillus sp. HZG1 TaxID=3111769 RepID=UPI002DBC2BD7|nr:hypothetical protein [Halobacillus sp. HZG1]MEC3885741.1 hypothetical protein [Halobacillus sp. HZG1]